MALLHPAVQEKKFDVRVVEKNLSRGAVTAEEVKKATDQLPDDAENAEWISVETLAAEGDEGSSGATTAH